MRPPRSSVEEFSGTAWIVSMKDPDDVQVAGVFATEREAAAYAAEQIAKGWSDEYPYRGYPVGWVDERA